MTGPAISVDGLRFSYGDLEAVKGISFDVGPGEVLGFLGPNGAGRSTTIKVVTGQLPPSGSILASAPALSSSSVQLVSINGPSVVIIGPVECPV